jgi:hypothetical protein
MAKKPRNSLSNIETRKVEEAIIAYDLYSKPIKKIMEIK